MKYHDKKVIVYVHSICRFDVEYLWNGCFPLKGEGVKWNLLVMEVVKGLKCEFVCNEDAKRNLACMMDIRGEGVVEPRVQGIE